MNLRLKTLFTKMVNKLQMPNKKKEKKTISNGHKIKMKFLLVNMDNSKVSEQEVVLNFWVHSFQEQRLNNVIREVNNFNLKR